MEKRRTSQTKENRETIENQLFNLTFQYKQFVSTLPPTFLPDNDFSFVEITYNERTITSVKAIYNFSDAISNNISKECVLSDIDISKYLNNIKPLKNINLEFEGVKTDIENPTQKMFILSLCSYLVYTYFIEMPYETSLDLLDSEMFHIFTSHKPKNAVEKSWISQSSTFYNNFSYLFSNRDVKKDREEKEKESEESEESEKQDKRNPFQYEEIKEEEKEGNKEDYEIEMLVKKYLKKHIDEYSQKAIEKIEKEAYEISREVKDFKRKFLKDVERNSRK